jgi:hypothetical protein
MHPEFIRAIAAQQIDDWVAAAETDRQVKQSRASRSRRSFKRIGRRPAASTF